jgi:hypothetical protein
MLILTCLFCYLHLKPNHHLDPNHKLSNRIDAFNPKGEKLELCADSPSDKERWLDALESHMGVELVSMDEHPSRAGGWFG